MTSSAESHSHPYSDRIQLSANAEYLDISRLPTEVVALSSLRDGDYPRLSGQDRKHIELLAQTEQPLPPILVHRQSMQVIDGMHRLRAAELRCEREIEASFFDGDEEAAFILAVRLNIEHGLPLTLRDRTAAAERLLNAHTSWSDRKIANIAGLSASTVGAIRRRATGQSGRSNTRIGQDGRMRPLEAAEGRRRAGEVIARKPTASLRQIAKEAGISPGTARDVRARVERGEDPVPSRRHRGVTRKHNAGEGPVSQLQLGSAVPRVTVRAQVRQPTIILELLRKDPSIRSTESGRALLKWLSMHTAGAEKWTQYVDGLPPHSASMVIEAARGLVRMWNSFAKELEERMKADLKP
ncbi:ParB/RepB/Spo0J family partition protein [Sphaerisporangium rhizosphaerae]|uniref:ParB/RepB/Spo0J family partition protein n=1 Tax=Sphaerisporangium rhizosphaerae TaxID=2269375 RepID=A0ABW2PF87_9ACTN